jgi:glutamate decarboxylase
VGWVIWRDKEDLPEDLIFWVNYLGGNMATFALNFSRPGGQIVAQYYNFLRLGKEGYRKIHQACYDVAQWLADEIGKLGPFDIIYDGRGGIPALAWKLKEDMDHNFTLFDLADRLRTRGWLVPAYTLPANRQDLAIQRILVKHGFSKDLASLMMNDYVDSVNHFTRHPVSKPLTEEEAGSFRH